MTKPLIVVMSDQPRWTSDLPSTGSPGYRFCTCSTLEELQQVSSEQTPDGVIADLSQVSDGGHHQEQQLEVFRQNHADLPIAMLTDEACFTSKEMSRSPASLTGSEKPFRLKRRIRNHP
jgi:hypothetical protein